MTGGVLPSLQQWLLFSGVLIAVGCVAWRAVVAPGAARSLASAEIPALQGLDRRVAGVGLFTSLFLVLVWALRLVVQVIGFRDPFVPLSEDVAFLLRETLWGTVWIGQGLVLPALALAFWASRGSGGSFPRLSAAWWATGVLVLLLVATVALSSHAMGVEARRALTVMTDGAHVLAAGAWIGSLAVILVVAQGGAERGRLLAAQLRSFSPMAIGCVTTLIGMGVLLAWTHLERLADLWTSSYGRILVAKILLAGAVFLLGLLNWRRGLPALDTSEGVAAVHRRAAWEVSLAVGVLIVTAVLTQSAAP